MTEFRTHINQILDCAEKYNAPGCGAYGGPGERGQLLWAATGGRARHVSRLQATQPPFLARTVISGMAPCMLASPRQVRRLMRRTTTFALPSMPFILPGGVVN